jgi:hypothetical protein
LLFSCLTRTLHLLLSLTYSLEGDVLRQIIEHVRGD